MGEFDVNRLTRMVEVFGQVAGKDRGYRDLVDQVAEFVIKRTGESAGALFVTSVLGVQVKGVFPGMPSMYGDFLNMLLEVAGTIFSATCHARDFKEAKHRRSNHGTS